MRSLIKSRKSAAKIAPSRGEITQLAAILAMVNQLTKPDASRGNAGTQNAADNRVGGRHRCTQDGRQIDPQGGGKESAQHEISELGQANLAARSNNPLGDRLHHLAARQHGTGRLADRSDQDGTQDGKHLAADRWTHVVGNIVGANVESHVAADDGGDRDDQPVAAKAALRTCHVEGDQRQEQDRQADRDDDVAQAEDLRLHESKTT